ncbi:hypothetical protein CLOM_g4695 [Closterium sp. NIES-68]|nr:hypothetical protein CLOM_g4695 [Closterium sp. NIES-68]
MPRASFFASSGQRIAEGSLSTRSVDSAASASAASSGSPSLAVPTAAEAADSRRCSSFVFTASRASSCRSQSASQFRTGRRLQSSLQSPVSLQRLPVSVLSPFLPLVVLVVILLLSASHADACPRRLLAQPQSPLSGLVKDDIVALIAELRDIKKHYSIITQYMEQLVAVPNADFAWAANTTWLLPTDKAITMARKKDKTFTGTITPCHFIQFRRAYSYQECGEPTPLIFIEGNWMAGSAGGNGADFGGTTCTVKRFLPPAARVVIGSVDDKKTRGTIVHPSLFEGTYFSAHGVDSLIMP